MCLNMAIAQETRASRILRLRVLCAMRGEVRGRRRNGEVARVSLEVLGSGPCATAIDDDSAPSLANCVDVELQASLATRPASRYRQHGGSVLQRQVWVRAAADSYCISARAADILPPATSKASCAATAMRCSPARTTTT